MILIDNLNILKSSYPNIWNEIKQFEDEENKILTEIEETRNGNKTLSIAKDDKKIYLHSKYNPLKEAETIVDSFDDIDENTNVIFYGTGLGYHIRLILEKYKEIKYYIYEPIPELLYAFLSNVNLKDLKMNRLMGISTNFEGNSIDKFVDRNRDNIKIIEMPSHKQNFTLENEKFNEGLLKMIKNKRTEIATNFTFQKRWIINSMKNLKDVLSTPNIILEKKDKFKGKTAIIVAAGPSLNEEIENLRYIKENGLAYIFSVGSAIRTLLHHDLYPDAVCTYDPKPTNHWIYKTIKDKEIKEIPMIFGSSVGYETLIDYPGDKYHMITSQDTVSHYYLKSKDNTKMNIVFDAPSIAVVTIQLLYELGISTVILVGQNLAYRGEKTYSEGISYRKDLTEEQKSQAISVKDVYGNDILTNEGFDSMRRQMEYYFNVLPNIEVINTTKGGANIKGTKFIELEEVMKTNLKQKIVSDRLLAGNKKNYDKDYLELKLNKMDREYSKVPKINKEYNTILNKIDRAIKNKNFPQAEKLYSELDKALRKIENNDYYKTFILPLNRVEYKMLADSIDGLNEEFDLIEKGKRLLEKFSRFMYICTENIEMLEPIYEEMKEEINKYIGGNKFEETNSNS